MQACPICFTEAESRIASCPECGRVYHYEHLQNWLRNHVECPVCRTQFSFEFMNTIRPSRIRKISTSESRQDYSGVEFIERPKPESKADVIAKFIMSFFIIVMFSVLNVFSWF